MKKMLFALMPASLIQSKTRLHSASFFLILLYLPVVFLMQRGCAAYYRAVFACFTLVKESSQPVLWDPWCAPRVCVGHVLGKGQALSSKSSQAAAGGGETNKQFMMGYKTAAKSVQGPQVTSSMKGLDVSGPQITLLLRELSCGNRICLTREPQKCRRCEGKKSFDIRREYCQGN